MGWAATRSGSIVARTLARKIHGHRLSAMHPLTRLHLLKPLIVRDDAHVLLDYNMSVLFHDGCSFIDSQQAYPDIHQPASLANPDTRICTAANRARASRV